MFERFEGKQEKRGVLRSALAQGFRVSVQLRLGFIYLVLLVFDMVNCKCRSYLL